MTETTRPIAQRGATVVHPTPNGTQAANGSEPGEAAGAAEASLHPTQPDGGVPVERTAARRARFRSAVAELSARSSADDLIRWMLLPGSILVFLGFGALLLGWIGAARTAREIEQIPYLISGGLVGLALVVLGGLLLVSTFWVAVLRKLQVEAEARARSFGAAEVDTLRARLAELESRPVAARPKGAARGTTRRTASGSTSRRS
jgi:hypothetical protein